MRLTHVKGWPCVQINEILVPLVIDQKKLNTWKMFMIHISNKTFVSRIYKELYEINRNRTGNLRKKLGKYEEILHIRDYLKSQ